MIPFNTSTPPLSRLTVQRGGVVPYTVSVDTMPSVDEPQRVSVNGRTQTLATASTIDNRTGSASLSDVAGLFCLPLPRFKQLRYSGVALKSGRVILFPRPDERGRVRYSAIHRFLRTIHEHADQLRYPHKRPQVHSGTLVTRDDAGNVAIIDGLPVRPMSDAEYAYLIGESKCPPVTPKLAEPQPDTTTELQK